MCQRYSANPELCETTRMHLHNSIHVLRDCFCFYAGSDPQAHTETDVCCCSSEPLYCCRGAHALHRFAALGLAVVSVCAASFGPFIMTGQLSQVSVLSPPFPFSPPPLLPPRYQIQYSFVCTFTHLYRHSVCLLGGLNREGNSCPRRCVYGTRPVSAHPRVQLSIYDVNASWRSELG